MAAQVGLAAQLAKQAAQAARDEVAAATGEAPKKAAITKGWTVPVLPHNFILDNAMERATLKVTGHYRTVLAPQGLRVDLEPAETAVEVGGVAAGRHPDEQMQPNLQASLREQGTGRLVKAYTPPALLTLFATQQQATGVVVDGQV